MANFTEQAIKTTFMKLLSEKPLSQISVRMIAEECGINRNSFYYHFRDIPDLMEAIVREDTEELIARYPTVDSLGECVGTLLSRLSKERRAILHIYNSVNRDIYERYLMKITDYIARKYMTTAFCNVDGVSDDDRETAVSIVRSALFGLSFDWIMGGMDEDAGRRIRRLTEVCSGLSDDIIKRIQSTR